MAHADGIIVRGATVSYSADGKSWVDLGSLSEPFSLSASATDEPSAPMSNPLRSLVGVTFTLTFTIAGLSLPYRRCQLLLDLGRYTRWPNTN